MNAEDVRTILGLTVNQFWTGLGLGAAATIACYELAEPLARWLAVHAVRNMRGPGLPHLDRPSSIPLRRLASQSDLVPVTARRREVIHAKRGVWDR